MTNIVRVGSHADVIDVEALANKAKETKKFVYRSEHVSINSRLPNLYIPCCVAIADQHGRTAVWNGNVDRRDLKHPQIAFSAFLSAYILNNVAVTPKSYRNTIQLYEHASTLWDPACHKRSGRYLLAQAACRILHAKTLELECNKRDERLVALWDLDPAKVLIADEAVLDACLALLEIGDKTGASAILKGRPAFSQPSMIVERIP